MGETIDSLFRKTSAVQDVGAMGKGIRWLSRRSRYTDPRRAPVYQVGKGRGKDVRQRAQIGQGQKRMRSSQE